MASTTFLQQLQSYPKDTINDEMIELLEPYFNMEDYNMDTATRVCGDVSGLLSWTRAMSFFFGVNKEVLPLKVSREARDSGVITHPGRSVRSGIRRSDRSYESPSLDGRDDRQ